MAAWRGFGQWVDSGGHAVTIKALQSTRHQPGKETISVENKNPDWCGRGYVEADGKIAVGFENGVCLSGHLSEDNNALLWEGGHKWNRQEEKREHEKRTHKKQQEDNKPSQHMDEKHEDGSVFAQETQSNSTDALKRETMLLHSWFDRVLLMVMVFVSGVMCLWCLPSMLATVAKTLLMSLASGGALAWWFTPVSIDKVLIILVNAVVIAPFNVALKVLYWPTWPLRQPIYRYIQMVWINNISIPRQHTTFWKATFVPFLDMLPGAFGGILPKDVPFDNIDNAKQEDARDAYRRAVWLVALNKYVKAHTPIGVVNSVGVRLFSQLIMSPTLGWWWMHQVSVPFLPLPEDGDTRPPLPAVVMDIPKCYILDVWRKTYGEDLGRQKCLNE